MSFRVHRANTVIPRHQQPPIFAARGRVDRLVDALDRDHGRHLWVVVDVGDEALDPDVRRLQVPGVDILNIEYQCWKKLDFFYIKTLNHF